MNFESMVQLDPRIWPLAVMAFLRVATVFFLLPIFGENAVPRQLRIAIALMVTICIWPSIESPIRQADNLMQWSPITLAIATFREIVYGFGVAFSARMVIYAAEIGANAVGANMGFGSASVFSIATNREESPFAAYQGWIALILILVLNVHHVFLEGLANSFRTIPIGPVANGAALVQVAGGIVTSCFVLGIKLAAPLIIIQLLVNVVLGCLARAVPQLNVFVLSFPLSFLLSMIVIFTGAGVYIRYLSGPVMNRELAGYSSMQKVFSDKKEPVK